MKGEVRSEVTQAEEVEKEVEEEVEFAVSTKNRFTIFTPSSEEGTEEVTEKEEEVEKKCKGEEVADELPDTTLRPCNVTTSRAVCKGFYYPSLRPFQGFLCFF